MLISQPLPEIDLKSIDIDTCMPMTGICACLKISVGYLFKCHIFCFMKEYSRLFIIMCVFNLG